MTKIKSEYQLSSAGSSEGVPVVLSRREEELFCKNYKKKCCKKYKKGDQCRRCPKLAAFDRAINQFYLMHSTQDAL